MKYPYHDDHLGEIEIHEDNPRGRNIPPPIWRMYEDHKLIAEEVMLLIKIDALQDERYGGCWATNRYLGKWWNKTSHWVSETVAKFKKMGLVEVKLFPKGRKTRRVITVLFHGDAVYPKREGCGLNHRGVCGLNHRNHNTTYYREKKTTARQNGETVAAGNFGINGELPIEEGSRSFQLIKRYHKFSTAKKFHVRAIHPETKKVTYAKGAGVGGWTRRTLKNWQAHCEALLQQHPYKKVKRLMLWYFDHCEDEWLPAMCRTMPSFCERFDGIEKAWRRQNKKDEKPKTFHQRIKLNGAYLEDED